MKRQQVLHNGSNKLNMADFCMGGRTGWLNCYFPYLSSLLGWGCGTHVRQAKIRKKVKFREAARCFLQKQNSTFFKIFSTEAAPSKGACGGKKIIINNDFSLLYTLFIALIFHFQHTAWQWVQVWVTDFAIQYFYGKSDSDRSTNSRHFKGSVTYHIFF